jgi:hypothetical protein
LDNICNLHFQEIEKGLDTLISSCFDFDGQATYGSHCFPYKVDVDFRSIPFEVNFSSCAYEQKKYSLLKLCKNLSSIFSSG